MNLKNKKVLITGATGGIGKCLVEKFYNFGSIIAATGTNEEKLKSLKEKFPNIHCEKFKLDEELESVLIQIRAKTNKNKFVYISKLSPDPKIRSSHDPIKIVKRKKNFRKRNYEKTSFLKPANVEGSFQLLKKNSSKLNPINKLAARVVGIRNKKDK